MTQRRVAWSSSSSMIFRDAMTSSSSSMPPPLAAGLLPAPAPRQQVSIERLPARRPISEPRESMNCKSCRKRKIKCNRVRPSCEACRVFQCPCVYDAVPKKRGPKTDVLEALLRRVDGLEAKLKEKNAGGQNSHTSTSAKAEAESDGAAGQVKHRSKRPLSEPNLKVPPKENSISNAELNPPSSREHAITGTDSDALLSLYFARFHGKPYFILDEASVRQQAQSKQLPDFLRHAICAVASRHTTQSGGPQAALERGQDYALQSRAKLNTDEPSMNCLQALLLLVVAFMASGQGKRAYMLMTSAIGMAMALELHREIDAQSQVSLVDKELRRRLFWTCYLLDRFLACGSKRSSLISDSSIALRLPSWCPSSSCLPVLGDLFQQSSNPQHHQGNAKWSQGNVGMLIDITRILGKTNRYLAAGGVKGDSHFPWHSLSTLSKIKGELDFWASGVDDVLSAPHTIFGQTEATVVFLSRLIYHLIHCLVYRPFLPVDLVELAGINHHESWQVSATNTCFVNANAICELVDAARQAGDVEWPAIVGYCICTAATVHIHGAYYATEKASGEAANLFRPSSDMLSREMQKLNDFDEAWPNMQHQSATLQGICSAHGELVQVMATSSNRHSPGFHLEDFFDRYANIGGPGGKTYRFDAAHVSMSDVVIDFHAARHDEGQKASYTFASEGQAQKRKNDWMHEKRPDVTGSRLKKQQQPVLVQQLGGKMPTLHGATFQIPVGQKPQSHNSPASIGLQVPQAPDGHFKKSFSDTGLAPLQDYEMLIAHSSGGMDQGAMVMSGAGFMSCFGHVADSGGPIYHHQGYSKENENSLGPLFGALPTDALGVPVAFDWQADDVPQRNSADVTTDNGFVLSPGDGMAKGGGNMTGQSEENDPFLHLLEQLAEGEQRFPGTDADFDFFLDDANTHSAS